VDVGRVIGVGVTEDIGTAVGISTCCIGGLLINIWLGMVSIEVRGERFLGVGFIKPIGCTSTEDRGDMGLLERLVSIDFDMAGLMKPIGWISTELRGEIGVDSGLGGVLPREEKSIEEVADSDFMGSIIGMDLEKAGLISAEVRGEY